MTDSNLDTVFATLSTNATKWRTVDDWPLDALTLCGANGFYQQLSGASIADDSSLDSAAADQIELLIRLAKADLLTTFVITQHLGAIKRILAADSIVRGDAAGDHLKNQVLPKLMSGQEIASVGISHLTTSRLHLGRPAVLAEKVSGGYQLNGTIPWVTGAPSVQQIVVGATLENGSQVLVLMSPESNGVECGRGAEMIAMSASCTDAVTLRDVFVADSFVLAGPKNSVLSAAKKLPNAPSGAGGLQTSALALGLSYAALDFIRSESEKRSHLKTIVEGFEAAHHSLHDSIKAAANGDSSQDLSEIRTAANGLVQRTTSAAMTTAKGAGLMIDHPVSRWCQQAFFFLVWSCPQPVAQAHLCEMVGSE